MNFPHMLLDYHQNLRAYIKIFGSLSFPYFVKNEGEESSLSSYENIQFFQNHLLGCLFPNVYFWNLCQKSNNCSSVGLIFECSISFYWSMCLFCPGTILALFYASGEQFKFADHDKTSITLLVFPCKSYNCFLFL